MSSTEKDVILFVDETVDNTKSSNASNPSKSQTSSQSSGAAYNEETGEINWVIIFIDHIFRIVPALEAWYSHHVEILLKLHSLALCIQKKNQKVLIALRHLGQCKNVLTNIQKFMEKRYQMNREKEINPEPNLTFHSRGLS